MIKSLNDIPPVRDYLARVGAEPRSLKAAVVRENRGPYWKDLAVIRFSKEGEITCREEEFKPTEAEQAAISKAWAKVSFPEISPLKRLFRLPPELKATPSAHLFEYRNIAGDIVMVQQRVERKGERAYVPWTYWSDEMWRMCEPDGPLPLYNAHRLKDATTVFIHEGAKAARLWQRLVDGESARDREELAAHPWGRELSWAVHLGWTGGAMSPQRTDWDVLKEMGITRAYMVADNDTPGKGAIAKIAFRLRIPTFAIEFTDDFPATFDLADPFPKEMFTSDTLSRYYIGPSFYDCLKPATWATDMVKAGEQGRPTAVLRDSFKHMWAYVRETDLYVCKEMPSIVCNEQTLNKMLSAYSHVAETSKLIHKEATAHVARFAYRPDHPGQHIIDRNRHAINLHTPCRIPIIAGDPQPWLDYLAYMFPVLQERQEVERWCATLIAQPGTRMGYGLLLISESQGIGKTTLASAILAPLVGKENVSYPGESDILSDFNDWAASKRLVIVPEIYQGASWKSYQRLKHVVTDREITINKKFQHPYTIDNWVHIVACSNSKRALKIEEDDRRWLCPKMTEVPWPGDKFVAFRRWLQTGGLSIIRHWANTSGNYVKEHERAPMTESKAEMIEGSMSEAQQQAQAVAESMQEKGSPCAIEMEGLRVWVREHTQGKVFDNDYELRKVMTKKGVKQWPERMTIRGRKRYVLINQELWVELEKVEGQADKHNLIREKLTTCSELMKPMM